MDSRDLYCRTLEIWSIDICWALYFFTWRVMTDPAPQLRVLALGALGF
jgi:hypothetical protein